MKSRIILSPTNKKAIAILKDLQEKKTKLNRHFAKKGKSGKSPHLLKQIVSATLSVFKLLSLLLSPLLVLLSPSVPYIITDDARWMLLNFISIPVGLGLAVVFWDKLAD